MDYEFIVGHSLLMAQSFFKATGKSLCDGFSDNELLAEKMFEANFALVSHGLGDDPIFNYANLQAQMLWELDWDEFVKMPSRNSAGNTAQTERNELLQKAKSIGYVDNYFGIRKSKTGKMFEIQNTIIWSLIDNNQNFCGQAAMIPNWKFL